MILINEPQLDNQTNEKRQNDKQNSFNNHYLSVSQISINEGARSGIKQQFRIKKASESGQVIRGLPSKNRTNPAKVDEYSLDDTPDRWIQAKQLTSTAMRKKHVQKQMI